MKWYRRNSSIVFPTSSQILAIMGNFPSYRKYWIGGEGAIGLTETKKDRKEDTLHRKVPTFMYEKLDEVRIMVIAREAKCLGVAKKIFG